MEDRQKQEVLVNMGLVNLLALGIMVVLGGVSIALYIILRVSIGGETSVAVQLGLGDFWKPLLFFIMFILLIYIHERIHGFGYHLLGGAKTTYSIQWKNLAVAACAQSPMPINAYRWSLSLPTLIIAVPLYLLGFIHGNFLVLFMGCLQVVGGASDIAILFALRKFPSNVTALDHPSKTGCTVYFPPN